MVEDGAIARTSKVVDSRHKVTVCDVQGGGDQSADIDRCALTEQDAVRVDQKHFAVGQQTAQNARRIGTQHSIERHGVAARLHELNRLLGSDIEALPVDRHVRR